MNTLRSRGGILLVSLWLVLLVGLRAELIMDDAGRFAIDMGAPQTRSENPVKDGFPIHLLLHEEGTTVAYMVSYNDVSAEGLAKLNVTEVMQGAMKDFLAATNSTMVTGRDHPLGEIKGWEFSFADKKGTFSGRARYYFVGARFYQVVYMGPTDSENSEKSLHYLDSFRALH
jgi:hypothetical protein